MKRKFLIAIVVVLSIVLACGIGYIVYAESHRQDQPEKPTDAQKQTDPTEQQDTTAPVDTQTQPNSTTAPEETTLPDFTYEDDELPVVPIPQDTPSSGPAQTEPSATEGDNDSEESETEPQTTEPAQTTAPTQTQENSGVDEDELPGAPIV